MCEKTYGAGYTDINHSPRASSGQRPSAAKFQVPQRRKIVPLERGDPRSWKRDVVVSWHREGNHQMQREER